jgi:copper(I)-binding protein
MHTPWLYLVSVQDSVIVGTSMPPALGALYRDIMSPYCPGLTLSSCPSPQADSLRKAIAVRYNAGETPAQITESLVQHYGPSVRGAPTTDGFGLAAYLGPVVVLVVGAALILRWLRKHQHRAGRAATFVACTLLGGTSVTACTTPSEETVVRNSVLVIDSVPVTASINESASDAVPYVSDAWVRAGTEGRVTGGYAVVHNPSAAPVNIVGATSTAADTVELHETVQNNGMVSMVPQPLLTIPARDSVQFVPGGKHFMLQRLQRSLSVGDTVSIALLTANGDRITFIADVRAAGAAATADRKRMQ